MRTLRKLHAWACFHLVVSVPFGCLPPFIYWRVLAHAGRWAYDDGSDDWRARRDRTTVDDQALALATARLVDEAIKGRRS